MRPTTAAEEDRLEPRTKRVALGRLEIDLSGADFIADSVREEVAHQSSDRSQCTGRLSFHFGHTAEAGDGAVEIDSFEVGKTVVHLGDRLMPCSLRWDGTDLQVTVASTSGFWKSPFFAPAVRLIDQSFNDSSGRLSKRFYYTVFDQAVQIAQVPLRQSWIHSSAVTNGERTLLFMAWGGVGKTSTLLKMLETGSWRFLSDDLAVIDETGTVYRSPQKIQVYASNVAGQDALRARLLGGRSSIDLAHWAMRRRVLGPKSVRRRVHVEDLFGVDSVAVSGRVTDAVYLRRTTAPDFQVDVSTPRDLARLGASVLQAELDPLYLWLTAIHSASPFQNWPTVDEMIRDTTSIIEAGLIKAGSRCVIVDVPKWSGPDDLLRFVHDQVLS
jgi:hypothetical protein